MNISTSMQSVSTSENTKSIKTNFTEKISAEDAKELRSQISQNAQAMMFKSTSLQVSVSNSSNSQDNFAKNQEDFKSFLSDIGYEGKPLAELSQEEAADLISEDGLLGIKQTSERIANFVIDGSNGNEDRMRAGREGMLEGFKMAEKMWGGELPEISQKTMDAAIEMVDKAMYDAGFSIVDTQA
jgi:hypothetical protein